MPPESPPSESGGGKGASDSPGLTALLDAAGRGDDAAYQRAIHAVYAELHSIAQARMRHERPGHTLQATALVNEAYLRLLGKPDIRWAGRSHFFRAASEAMRKVLIDHARLRNAEKRGGGKGIGERAALLISGVADLAPESSSTGILALDDAILRLEQVDAQAASVVRLRFYAGITEPAVAEALGISERTVRRDWAFARGWLRDTLERQAAQDSE